MALIWLLTVLLAGWFSFELGRKWDAGKREEELAAQEDEQEARQGIKLSRLTIRR